MAKLTPNDRKALRLFAERLRAAYPRQIEDVRLFGSKARGDATKYSDVDVLVVLKRGDWRDRRRVSGISAAVLLETGVVLSAKMFTREQFDRMKARRSVFWQTIQPDLTPV